MNPKTSTPRRRGAPPGNRNALKHGFYASKLPKADRDALASDELTNLAPEIELIRVFIRRAAALGANSESLSETLETLRVISLAITALSRLIRTNDCLPVPRDHLSEEFARLLKLEYGVDDTEELSQEPTVSAGELDLPASHSPNDHRRNQDLRGAYHPSGAGV